LFKKVESKIIAYNYGKNKTNMERKIYQVLRKHRLPLKKREELMPDLLALFNAVEQSEQLPNKYCPQCGEPIAHWCKKRS
jgi:hypothetical protein